MPISASDILQFLSGGAGNSDPSSALGGVISSTQVTDNTLHNLFDRVAGAESQAGDTEYRCVYIQNNHATLTLQDAKIYIESQTPSSDTSFEIGLGTSAIDGTEQAIADEDTAPSGVTFEAGVGSENALSIGDLAAGETKAIWIKRVVGASAVAYAADQGIIRVEGDTDA